MAGTSVFGSSEGVGAAMKRLRPLARQLGAEAEQDECHRNHSTSRMVGSCVGAGALIAHLISQRTQTILEQTEARLRERESLYGEFITEASRLAVDALEHSLERIDKLVSLYGVLGRIRS